MYTYYLLAILLGKNKKVRHASRGRCVGLNLTDAPCAQRRDKWLWWGRYLTQFQMLQFLANLVQAWYCERYSPYPRFLSTLLFWYMISLLGLFGARVAVATHFVADPRLRRCLLLQQAHRSTAGCKGCQEEAVKEGGLSIYLSQVGSADYYRRRPTRRAWMSGAAPRPRASPQPRRPPGCRSRSAACPQHGSHRQPSRAPVRRLKLAGRGSRSGRPSPPVLPPQTRASWRLAAAGSPLRCPA